MNEAGQHWPRNPASVGNNETHITSDPGLHPQGRALETVQPNGSTAEAATGGTTATATAAALSLAGARPSSAGPAAATENGWNGSHADAGPHGFDGLAGYETTADDADAGQHLPAALATPSLNKRRLFSRFFVQTRCIDVATEELAISDIERSAKVRRPMAAAIFLLYLLALILLIMVETGSTSKSRSSTWLYFLRLDLSAVIPESRDNTVLINAITRSIGLHDFYQVGLWNYCNGYFDAGVTYCSPPTVLFWFNPKKVIIGELMVHATLTLPRNFAALLVALRIVSNIMFSAFLAGLVLNIALLAASPLALAIPQSRWRGLVMTLGAGLAAALVLLATILATVFAASVKLSIAAQTDFNIGSTIGVSMFVFIWLAAMLNLAGFVLHAILGCCTVGPFRNIKTGRHTLPVDNGAVSLPPQTVHSGPADIYSATAFVTDAAAVNAAVQTTAESSTMTTPTASLSPTPQLSAAPLTRSVSQPRMPFSHSTLHASFPVRSHVHAVQATCPDLAVGCE